MDRNIDHVDHISLISRPENLAAHAQALSALTGASLQGPYEMGNGLQCCLDIRAGLRIVAPSAGAETPAANEAREILDRQGEGIYSVTFGVPDLDAAVSRARARGFAPGPVTSIRGDSPGVDGTVRRHAECQIDTYMDTLFRYAEIEYEPGIVRRKKDGRADGPDQYLNRFDHIAWVCHPQNMEHWIERLSRLSNSEMDPPFAREDLGVSLSVNWGTGLEVVAPIESSNEPMTQLLRHILDTRGESVFAIVYGVPDMDEARDRARSAGFEPSEAITDPGKGPWVPKLLKFSESFVGEFMNIPFLFGEIEYADGVIRK